MHTVIILIQEFISLIHLNNMATRDKSEWLMLTNYKYYRLTTIFATISSSPFRILMM